MANGRKVPLTTDAYERLQEELRHLEGPAREHIVAEIARARAHGDLSENAEYHTAKDQQGMQEGRIRQIRSMLQNAEIIEAADDGVAKPGMLVTIRHEGDDPETYLLGTREEESGDVDLLTPDSPIGRALVGHSAGTTITVEVPAGDMKVEILEVRAP